MSNATVDVAFAILIACWTRAASRKPCRAAMHISRTPALYSCPSNLTRARPSFDVHSCMMCPCRTLATGAVLSILFWVVWLALAPVSYGCAILYEVNQIGCMRSLYKWLEVGFKMPIKMAEWAIS